MRPTNSWPDHQRHGDGLLRPGVPVVDVHVGAADAGPQDLDQHVVDADLGTGTSSSQRPSSAFLFTSAFIDLLSLVVVFPGQRKGDSPIFIGRNWDSPRIFLLKSSIGQVRDHQEKDGLFLADILNGVLHVAG